MNSILDKLPGNDRISLSIGEHKDQQVLFSLYRNLKIILSYAYEDWPFVEEVQKALRIYFPQDNTFEVDNGIEKYCLPNVFKYTNDGKPFEWVKNNNSESEALFNNKNSVAADRCYKQIIEQANVFVIFSYGNKLKSGPENKAGAGCWQTGEYEYWTHKNAPDKYHFQVDLSKAQDSLPRKLNWTYFEFPSHFEHISACAYDKSSAQIIAEKIVRRLLFNQPTHSYIPKSSVFSYEKDIVQLYQEIPIILSDELGDQTLRKSSLLIKLLGFLKDGVPLYWPSIAIQSDFQYTVPNPLFNEVGNEIGSPRKGLEMLWPTDFHNHTEKSHEKPDMVIAAALSKYHEGHGSTCMLKENLSFPEAGPRENIYATPAENVAIVVSGGIAPGINAVIDGIVSRHKKYNSNVKILGINNGFYTLTEWNNQFIEILHSKDTSARVTEGGSILQTCRQKELLPSSENQIEQVQNIVNTITSHRIKILYVIGGDGSMRAAHQIAYACRQQEQLARNDLKISVVGIPKTMDNDILWVWQTFGFATAVEKAREIIDHLATEVKANPRICVLQLFGSASGFVVSHAVLASRTDTCDFALIPEAEFSIDTLAWKLAKRMVEDEKPRIIPFGLIVMAESAIPIRCDCDKYKDLVGLTKEESEALTRFLDYRDENPNCFPDGQISNDLRSAGLKLVSVGLKIRLKQIFQDDQLKSRLAHKVGIHPLPDIKVNDEERFRIFTNEPRHLLRSVPPSFSDVIMGNRLGALAVDNAMAGYTDFMISQWLTEFVLVPLDLVAIGRKHIPQDGIFWKSVLAKTGQGNLVKIDD